MGAIKLYAHLELIKVNYYSSFLNPLLPGYLSSVNSHHSLEVISLIFQGAAKKVASAELGALNMSTWAET